MKVTVLKYYSVGTYHNVVVAQKRLNETQKLHPDRRYTILTNIRGGATKFVVAQVEEVTVDLPTEDDLNLPPIPDHPRLGLASVSSQAYQDWKHECDKRTQLVTAAQSSGLAVIKRKLNSP